MTANIFHMGASDFGTEGTKAPGEEKVGFVDSGYILLLQGGGGHSSASSFVYPFTKHLFSMYYVLGTAL